MVSRAVVVHQAAWVTVGRSLQAIVVTAAGADRGQQPVKEPAKKRRENKHRMVAAGRAQGVDVWVRWHQQRRMLANVPTAGSVEQDAARVDKSTLRQNITL